MTPYVVALAVAFLAELIIFGRVALMAWREEGKVTNTRLGLVLVSVAANIVLLSLLGPDKIAAGTWGWLFDRVALWTPVAWLVVIIIYRLNNSEVNGPLVDFIHFFTEGIIRWFSWGFVFVWLFSVVTLFLLQFEIFHFGTLVLGDIW